MAVNTSRPASDISHTISIRTPEIDGCKPEVFSEATSVGNEHNCGVNNFSDVCPVTKFEESIAERQLSRNANTTSTKVYSLTVSPSVSIVQAGDVSEIEEVDLRVELPKSPIESMKVSQSRPTIEIALADKTAPDCAEPCDLSAFSETSEKFEKLQDLEQLVERNMDSTPPEPIKAETKGNIECQQPMSSSQPGQVQTSVSAKSRSFRQLPEIFHNSHSKKQISKSFKENVSLSLPKISSVVQVVGQKDMGPAPQIDVAELCLETNLSDSDDNGARLHREMMNQRNDMCRTESHSRSVAEKIPFLPEICKNSRGGRIFNSADFVLEKIAPAKFVFRDVQQIDQNEEQDLFDVDSAPEFDPAVVLDGGASDDCAESEKPAMISKEKTQSDLDEGLYDDSSDCEYASEDSQSKGTKNEKPKKNRRTSLPRRKKGARRCKRVQICDKNTFSEVVDLSTLAPAAEMCVDAIPSPPVKRQSTGLMTFPIPENNEESILSVADKLNEDAWERSKLKICKLKQKRSEARGLKATQEKDLFTDQSTNSSVKIFKETGSVKLEMGDRQIEQRKLSEVRPRLTSQIGTLEQPKAKDMMVMSARSPSTVSHISNDSSKIALGDAPKDKKKFPTVLPMMQSNRQLIKNALHVCLAGSVNEKAKKDVLEDLEASSASHFIILFRGLKNHAFKGLYSYDPRLQHVVRVYSQASLTPESKLEIHAIDGEPIKPKPSRILSGYAAGPSSICASDVLEFYKYDSGSRTFKVVPTKSFGVSVHAIAQEILQHLADDEDFSLLSVIATPETMDESIKVLELNRQTQGRVKACIGIHPGQQSSFVQLPAVLGLIEEEAAKGTLTAVGEIGLDFSPWVLSTQAANDPHASVQNVKTEQLEVFKRQVQLAKKLSLPVNVHSRNAGHHAIKVLEEEGMLSRALLHAFDGAAKYAQRAAQKGALFSIPGSIAREVSFQRLVQTLDLTSLCLESDAPALPVVKNGGRSWPRESLLSAVQHIAELKGVAVEDAANITTTNALRLFIN
ncbi:putative deoxyribonuclease tatdn3 [Entophlyctis luteolus]|nr:putative deoxyribonuclease tatdn3 [Entophlyctis luteolus]